MRMQALKLTVAVAVAVAALAVAQSATAGSGDAPARAAADSQVGSPNAEGSWIARIVTDQPARRVPSSEGTAIGTVRSQAPWGRAPMQLLVDDVAVDVAGERWLRVLLARKPNGTYGWVRSDLVRLTYTPWRVRVDLSSRTLRLFRRGRLVKRARIVVGAPTTPTPTGSFAIREVVKQPDPNGFSGPWIFHLNANSERLKSFDGGDGTIGIHGRSGAALADPLGSRRSHGCVRVPNRVIRYLARHVPAGAPVEIVR